MSAHVCRRGSGQKNRPIPAAFRRPAARRLLPAAFGAAAALLLAAAPLPAQEAPVAASAGAAAEDDALAAFEAALFAGTGDAASESAAPAPTEAGRDAAVADSAFFPAADLFAAAVSGEAARTEYLVGGSVSLRASASALPGDGYTAVSDAKGKLFAKVSVPDYGAIFASYAASYPFFRGAAGLAAAPAPEAADLDFALAELHYSFDIGKLVFFRLGKQLLSWGPARIWAPVDFVNAEKEDSFADVDLRAGKNGLRLHLPLRRANLFLFADFSALNEDGVYGDPAEKTALAGRIDLAAGGFEFGLSGYGGAEKQARAGADFSGRAFGTTVYGELALAPAYGGYDHALQAALGFSRAVDELKRWTVSAEAFYNSAGSDRTGLDAAEWSVSAASGSAPTPLYEGRWYAYAALATTRLGSPHLSASAYLLANLQDRSFSAVLAPSLALPRAVPVSLKLSYSGGGADKEFTRFAGNGAVGLAVSTKLSF